jgi:hypothetical protein
MAHNRRDDDLAYGEYHGDRDGAEGDRGLMGDMGRRLFGGKKEVRPLSTKQPSCHCTPCTHSMYSSWLGT